MTLSLWTFIHSLIHIHVQEKLMNQPIKQKTLMEVDKPQPSTICIRGKIA